MNDAIPRLLDGGGERAKNLHLTTGGSLLSTSAASDEAGNHQNSYKQRYERLFGHFFSFLNNGFDQYLVSRVSDVYRDFPPF